MKIHYFVNGIYYFNEKNYIYFFYKFIILISSDNWGIHTHQRTSSNSIGYKIQLNSLLWLIKVGEFCVPVFKKKHLGNLRSKRGGKLAQSLGPLEHSNNHSSFNCEPTNNDFATYVV